MNRSPLIQRPIEPLIHLVLKKSSRVLKKSSRVLGTSSVALRPGRAGVVAALWALACLPGVAGAEVVRTFEIDPNHTNLQFSAKAQYGALVANAVEQAPGSLQTTATGSFSGMNVTSATGNYFELLPGSVVTLATQPGTWLPYSQPANFALSAPLGTYGAVRNMTVELGGNLKITTGGVVDSTAVTGTTRPGSTLDATIFGDTGSYDATGLSVFNAAEAGSFTIDGRDLVVTIPVHAVMTQEDSGLTLTGTMDGQVQARSVNALAAQFSWKSTTAGDFNDPNNWTGGVVPGPGTVATFELPMEILFPRELVDQWQQNVASLQSMNITAGRLVLAPSPNNGLGLVEGDWPGSITSEQVVIGRPGQLVIGFDMEVDAPQGVDNDGKLGGNGTVHGTVNNRPGSLIISGESVGKLTADDMIFQGDSGMLVELNDALGTAGTRAGGWDLLNITGTLDLQGTSDHPLMLQLATLNLDNLPGMATNFDAGASYSWVIARAGQIIGFDPGAFAFDTSAFQNEFQGTFGVSQQGSEILLTYQAIPEPATWLLAGMALIGLIGARAAVLSRSQRA